MIASITEAKNQLSALIDRVRDGETVIITDRGRPVARLSSAVDATRQDSDGRLARLERRGAIRRSSETPPARLILRSPPPARAGIDILEELLDERSTER